MYLNVIQLAESFGVEESVVEGWVRNEALPAIEDRGRFLFDRAQVVDWAARRGLVAKAGFLAPARAVGSSGRSIESLLHTGGIWRDVKCADVPGALERIVQNLPGVTPAIRQLLTQRLHATQGITWAPIGGGLAIPHLRAPVALGPQSGTLALLLLNEPLPMREPVPDDTPVTRLLFFIAPSPRAHLELLGQLSAALSRGDLRKLVLAAAPDAEIFSALNAADGSARKETAK
jgi:PTS system nitrogen regulatory IIA component